MTYWPIFSPSVFAATKTIDRQRIKPSSDGLASRATRHEQEGSLSDQQDVDQTIDGDTHTHKLKSDGPIEAAESDIHGEILALKITRDGQRFVSLTSSSLIVWQTKAWLPSTSDW